MIWQFGEIGYDYSINHCENGAIDEECRTAPKQLDGIVLSTQIGLNY